MSKNEQDPHDEKMRIRGKSAKGYPQRMKEHKASFIHEMA